jgi:hypothetical protein
VLTVVQYYRTGSAGRLMCSEKPAFFLSASLRSYDDRSWAMGYDMGHTRTT